MKITGAIFDFDGTLFDSMHIWKNVKNEFFEHIGIRFTDEDKEAFKGLYLRETLILAMERFNIASSFEELSQIFFRYIGNRYLQEATPKNDIIEFLEKLRQNNVKMSIATATGEIAVQMALEKYNMSHYFESIYSVYTVGASKNEPKVYRTSLESIGTDKETTWIFEDALYAAKTAKADGFHVVGIYDESEKNTDELRNLADVYIHNYSEIDI
ncbi:MAG: HAD family phosphatase [Clostridia bacterium]|nr:HAD family phosphatase [Clostridia bacterium]